MLAPVHGFIVKQLPPLPRRCQAGHGCGRRQVHAPQSRRQTQQGRLPVQRPAQSAAREDRASEEPLEQLRCTQPLSARGAGTHSVQGWLTAAVATEAPGQAADQAQEPRVVSTGAGGCAADAHARQMRCPHAGVQTGPWGRTSHRNALSSAMPRTLSCRTARWAPFLVCRDLISTPAAGSARRRGRDDSAEHG